MCGLTGLIGRAPKHAARFVHSMYNNQARGTDAFGIIGITPDGNFNVFKKAGAVYNNIAKCKFLDDAPALMGHTRMATHGSALKLINDHPFFAGDIIGMHNGVIHNHAEIGKGFDIQSECDSEPLFHIINAFRDLSDVQDLIDSVTGYYVITWVDRKTPDNIYLLRGGYSTSISMAELKGVGLIYSSDESHLPCYSTDTIRKIVLPQYSLTIIDTKKIKMTTEEYQRPKAVVYSFGGDWDSEDFYKGKGNSAYYNKNTHRYESGGVKTTTPATTTNVATKPIWKADLAKQQSIVPVNF
jgi:glucosamine 6-phosphate synthetase-like amidotransferase/phosphosugar isomerase protein